jgi:hypothetical protein
VRKELAVVLAAVGVAVAPLPPTLVDRVFSSRLYVAVQPAVTSFSNRAPFALFDVLVLSVAALWLVYGVRDARRLSLLRASVHIVARTAAWLAALYLAFALLWGLNYRRVRLADKVPFDASAITPDAARQAGFTVVAHVNALADQAHAAGWNESAGVDTVLAAAFDRARRDIGAAGAIVVGRPKHTLLDWYFRRAGVDGMTDPFFLETLIAGSVLPFERPFVVAHEWSHLAGIANEGDANFVGWLACMRGSTAHQYSGWLFLFGELANAVGGRDRAALGAELGPRPRADLQAIRDRFAREVNPRVSGAGWRVYDTYLKMNRVPEGAASYADVVRLVLGARVADNPLKSN